MTFYLCAAALILLGCALLLLPLLRRHQSENPATANPLEAKLALLERALQEGLLEQDEFTRKREALLQDAPLAPEQHEQTSQTDALDVRPARQLASYLLLALPLAVVLIYADVGNPSAIAAVKKESVQAAQALAQAQSQETSNNQPANGSENVPSGAASAQGDENIPDLKQAVANLSARLEKDPNDGNGWQLLGQSYLELQQHADAANALEKAVALLPPDADLYAQYGEALGLSRRPQPPPPEAEVQIDKALAINPNNQRALWLKGVFRRFAGDNAGALLAWRSLAKQLPAGSSVANALQSQIAEIAGADPGTLNSAASSAQNSSATNKTSNAANNASTGVSVQVSVDISPELKAKLAANDVLYIYVKAKNGPPMPLAIHRGPASELPITVTLGDADAMMPQMKLSSFKDVVVSARVSKSGVANAAPGDYQSATVELQLAEKNNAELLIKDVL